MAEIGSLEVSLSLNAGNFNGTISQVTQNMKAMGGELQALKAKGSDYESSINGLRQKQDILQRSFDASSLKLQEQRKRYDELVASGKATDAQLARAATAVNKAQAEYNKLETQLGQVTQELKTQSSEWTKAGQQLDEVGNKMKSMGSNISSIGSDLSMKVTAPILALGTASAKVAIDFEAQMDRVGAIADATAEEMQKLSDTALELGANTSKSATEVAIGMENMAAMGFTANEIMAAMPGIISAAEASGADMAQTADVVAAALNAFGLEASEASRVADILAQTANQSAADITDLQYAFKYAAPIANSLSISMEELAAATGIMSDAGIKGEQAGTTLRGGLIALLKPAEKTSQMMETMGITVEDAEGKFVGISGLIENISAALEGQTEVQKMATLAQLVGTEAASGFLTLIEAGPEKLDALTKGLENSAGASAETAAKMKDNLKGALEELGGTIETAAITIGNLLEPAIRKVAEVVQALIEKFQNLSPFMQGVSVLIAGIAAAIGPVIMIVGALISSIGTIATTFGAWSLAIGEAGGVLAMLTGPIGLAVGAIALIGTALVAAWNQSEEFRNAVTSTFEQVKSVISTVFNTVSSFLVEQFNNIKSQWDSVGPQFGEAVANVFNGIKAVVEFVMPAIQFVIEYVWGAIKNVITGALDVIMGAIKVFSGLFTGDFSKMWEGVKQIFSGAFKLILGWFSLTFVGGIRNLLTNLSKNAINIIKGKWTSIVSSFKTFGSNVLSNLKTTVTNAIKNFKQMKDDAVKWVTNLVKDTVTKIKELPGKFLQVGKDLVQGLINGIKQMGIKAIEAVTGLVNGVIDQAKSMLGIASPSKLFTQYGRWISEGLSIGIDDNADMVNKSVSNLINSATATAQKQISDIQALVSKSNKANAAEIAKIEKDLEAERLKITQDAQKKINDLRQKNAESSVKLTKEQSEKVADIEKKAAEKVAKIQQAAAKAGKKLTVEQTAQIAKINKEATAEITKIAGKNGAKLQEQAAETAKKIAEIERKAGEDRTKASKKAGEAIVKVEATISSDKMAVLKADAEARKQAGEMSLKDEVAYWKYTLTAFAKGSKEHTEALKLYNAAVNNLNKERLDNVKNYIADKKSLDQLSLKDEVLIWEANLKTFEEGSKERLEAQKSYKTALDTLNKEIISVNEKYQSEMQKINDDLIKQENEYTQKYKDAFDKRYSSLMSFAGLFDEFSMEMKNSGIDLLNNLQSQVSGFKSWQDEFEKLSARGIDADLLEELSGLGVKALPELMALNQLTDEQLSQYSALYQEKSQLARTQTETELIGMKEDMDIRITELREAANEQLDVLNEDWKKAIKALTSTTSSELSSLQKIGQDAGQGLLNGLASMEGPLIDKAKSIADAIRATIESALDIHSPSRVMKGIGINIGEGLIIGMDEMISKVAASSARLSDAVASAQGSLASSAQKSMQYGSNVTSSTSTVDNSRKMENNFTIYTTESPERVIDRKLKRMAFLF